MAVIRIHVEGMQSLRDNLGRFTKAVDETPLRILREEAPRIQAEARMNTPIQSGQLKTGTTVKVAHVKKRTATLTAESTAVNNGYDYANIQHENTEFNHPNGGRAFYLRDAFNDGVTRISARLGREVTHD